jgi:hypothetical protein
MRALRKIFRFIVGPNFLRDRPADQTRLNTGPFAGSERVLNTDDPEQASEAAQDVRRRGNFWR